MVECAATPTFIWREESFIYLDLQTISRDRRNTPGTVGGPGGRDRTLAIKSRKTFEKSHFFLLKKIYPPKKYFFLHISSSYAKILGQKLFRTREFPRSGSKTKDEKQEEILQGPEVEKVR